MFDVLIKIIPLDLASTLSPGILALTLIILADKNHPTARFFSFLSGSVIAGVGIGILGFTLGKSIDSGIQQNLTESIIDLFLGLFLVFYGLKIFFSKEKKISLKEEENEIKIFKWFSVGLILTITNFDAVLLNFSASKEVGGSEIDYFFKIIFLIINIIFLTLPITLPGIVKVCFPKIADPILNKINQWVIKYGRYIVLIMFVLFGGFLLYRGVSYFFN